MPKHAFIFKKNNDNNNNRHVQYLSLCKSIIEVLVVVVVALRAT